MPFLPPNQQRHSTESTVLPVVEVGCYIKMQKFQFMFVLQLVSVVVMFTVNRKFSVNRFVN